MSSNNWIVYILQCNDATLYTGITTNLEKRINQHENGKGAKYTKGRSPFKIMYTEICGNRSDVATFFRTVVNKEKSKLCPRNFETNILYNLRFLLLSWRLIQIKLLLLLRGIWVLISILFTTG